MEESQSRIAELEQKLSSADKSEANKIKLEMENILLRPYRDAGYPTVGAISRWMIRVRSHLFGEINLTSLRDEMSLAAICFRECFGGADFDRRGHCGDVRIAADRRDVWRGSGYVGGWLDEVMMRFVDILYSIPFIFVVIFIITVLSDEKIKSRLQDMGIDRITIFYFVVGAIYWLTMARVVRGQVISLRRSRSSNRRKRWERARRELLRCTFCRIC